MEKEQDKRTEFIIFFLSGALAIFSFFTLTSAGNALQTLLMGEELEAIVKEVNDDYILIEIEINGEVYNIKRSIKTKNKQAKLRYKSMEVLPLKHYKGSFLIYEFGRQNGLYMFLILILIMVSIGIRYFTKPSLSEMKKEG